MNSNIRAFGIVLVLAAAIVSRGAAQGRGQPAALSPEAMRDLVIEDSLTPAKMQLRDFVAQLRDTLNSVQALHDRIARNIATGMTSVALSQGRELGKRCRVGGAMAELTGKRIAAMHTNNPQGDQAISAYRAGLDALVEDLKACDRDDGVALSATAPDVKRIEGVAAAASDAVTRYDAIRDALMKLLDINLPLKGTIPSRHK